MLFLFTNLKLLTIRLLIIYNKSTIKLIKLLPTVKISFSNYGSLFYIKKQAKYVVL